LREPINAGVRHQSALLDLGPTLLQRSYLEDPGRSEKGIKTRNKINCAPVLSGHSKAFATAWKSATPVYQYHHSTIEPRITEIPIAIALA